MTKTQKTVDFLRDNGYKAIFDGDITDIEDGSINFENNPYVNVGVGSNYYTIAQGDFKNGSNYNFVTVENKGELLEKLADFFNR